MTGHEMMSSNAEVKCAHRGVWCPSNREAGWEGHFDNSEPKWELARWGYFYATLLDFTRRLELAKDLAGRNFVNPGQRTAFD